MFRQVISFRWADGVTDEGRAGYRQALAGLRVIPELIDLRFDDDARHFEGNFDVVAVMDFPSFPAARRYVADERHQAYIRDHASKTVGERVVVQHDWAVHDLVGIHHVTLPVSDINRSREWYVRALGLDVDSTSGDGGSVSLTHPSQPINVTLRLDPTRAAALAGFDAITLTLATRDDLDAFIARLDTAGIAHGDQQPSDSAVTIDLTDPDGIVVRLTTLLPDA